MRTLTDPKKIEKFMDALGSRVKGSARVYFTGGTTAVLLGWRSSTVDIDLKFVPDLDELYRQLPRLKEELEINIELAAPSDFIPTLPGWEERSIFIGKKGKLYFYHFDAYSQALSKIERGHVQDLADVESMFGSNMIDSDELWRFFHEIRSQLYRYPAIDPVDFEAKVKDAVGKFSK